jgi:DNA-binding transcriptional regulator YiaG
MVKGTSRDELLTALEAARALEAELLQCGSAEAKRRVEHVRLYLEKLGYGSLSPSEFKALRKKAGLTQEDLARILDRRLRQVRRYERGDTPVPHDVGAKLRDLAGGDGSAGQEPSGS